jgi:hypothetical protein
LVASADSTVRQRLAEIDQDIFAREHVPSARCVAEGRNRNALCRLRGRIGAAIVTTARASGISAVAASTVRRRRCARSAVRRPAGLPQVIGSGDKIGDIPSVTSTAGRERRSDKAGCEVIFAAREAMGKIAHRRPQAHDKQCGKAQTVWVGEVEAL